jgi:hypothetical protein
MVNSGVAVKSSAYLCSHGRSERSSDHAAIRAHVGMAKATLDRLIEISAVTSLTA